MPRARPTPLLLLLPALLLLPLQARAEDPTLDWKTIETEHFYIHYYKSSRHSLRGAALQAARAAEAAHARLAPALRHTPSGKTHIVLTDDADGANGSAQIVPMNIVRLLVTAPGTLSTLNDYDDWIYGLILHEYTHILHIDTIHGIAKLVNYVLGKTWAPNQVQPRWFIEGLATYYESARSSGGRVRAAIFDMYLRMAVLGGNLLQLDQITSNTRIFPRGNVPYLYGSQFLKYIADRFGEKALSQISHRYGRTVLPYAINRIAKEVTGHTYLELYEDFKRHLRHRYELVRAAVANRGLTRHQRITRDEDAVGSPVFSRDGRELAFAHSDGHSQLAIKILDVATGKVTQQFELYGGSGIDFTPDGRHLVFGEASWWRTFYSYDDLFVRERATGKVRQLTFGLRARDPSVSPDGGRVAFVQSDLGTMDLALIPFEGGAHRVLVKGERGDQLSTPRWSPDGRALVFSRWRLGGERDLHLYELASGKVRPLTRDRAIDVDPVFSADGKRVYFSSDRTGIYNIYCIELGASGGPGRTMVPGGELRQVTNVLGGAFTPAVSPDERRVYYVGFEVKGHDLHLAEVDPRRHLPALPYVNRRPPPTLVSYGSAEATVKKAPARAPEAAPPERYVERPFSPLPTLYPRNWSFNVGSSSFGTLIGIELGGADVVGRHKWSLVGNVATEKGYASYGLSYSYNRFWPSLTLDQSRYLGARGGIVEDGVRRNYIEENYGAGATIGLPVLRLVNHSASASVGYRLNWFRAGEGSQTSLTIPGAVSPKLPETGILAGLTFGLSYSNLQRYTWSISTEKGRQVGVNLRVDHPSLGSDYQTTQFNYSWTEFVPMPWWHDHVLALRLAGGIGTGSITRRGVYFLGGFPEQDVLRSFFDQTRVGGAYLRGYAPGTVYGDQYHLFNLEYRFPILNIEKGLSTMPIYFTHIHASVFADVGDAFFGDIDLSNLKVGVGAELLVEAVAGYFIPATFRIGYARGLMEGGGNEFHFLLGYPF